MLLPWIYRKAHAAAGRHIALQPLSRIEALLDLSHTGARQDSGDRHTAVRGVTGKKHLLESNSL